MSSVIVVVAIISLSMFNLGGDVHWPPWFYLSILCSGFIADYTYKRYGLIESLAVFYFLAYSFLIYLYKPALAGAGTVEQLSLKFLGMETVVSFLLLFFVFDSISKCGLRIIRHSLLAVFLLHGAITAYDILVLDAHNIKGMTVGLLGNKSMGANYLTVTSFLWSSPLMMGVAVYLIWLCQSGISFIALALGVSTFLFFWTRRKVLAALIGFGVLILTPWFEPATFLHIERYDAWRLFLVEWWENGRIMGQGPGSFFYWGPKIQMQENFKSTILWVWAHNDWLQILIEQGPIGLILSAGVFLKVCWNYIVMRDYTHLAASVSYGAIMVGNYPTNIALMAVLAFYLITYSYKGAEDER